MTQLAIKAENVWKEYRIHHSLEGPSSSLKELLNAPFRMLARKAKSAPVHEVEPFYALRDVSVEISHGESVGR